MWPVVDFEMMLTQHTPGKIILGELGDIESGVRQLGRYKGLDARWTDWGNVTDVCRSLAVEMVQ